MKLPALPFRFLKRAFIVSLILFFYVLIPPHLSVASAQGYSDSSINTDVPDNQHTKAQTVLIESMSALLCQIAGVDVINPEKGCLDIDPVTNKIGYVEQQPGEKRIGGLMRTSTQFIGVLFTQPASGISYVASLKDDFGIVKTAKAQTEDAPDDRSGFSQLAPLQGLWKASLNLTYLLFVVIFIFIGLAVMLRLKIDPRTVMSIQSQIPKVVIALLLITFSYSIVGFMIDIMWVTTYVGINTIAPQTTRQTCEGIGSQPNATLQQASYANLLDYPIAFVNNVFKVSGVVRPGSDCNSGILTLSGGVVEAIGSIVGQLVSGVITSGQVACNVDIRAISDSISGCTGLVVSSMAAFFAGILAKLIALIAIFVVLFRLWITLLKAYAYVIIFTILGPFWIVAGLIPGSTMGFSGWIRSVIAKLAVFPATAILIIISRIVLDIYDATPDKGTAYTAFVPPLIGNPNIAVFGPLIAFAILLITPELTAMIDGALKAPSGKMGAAVQKGFGQGSAIVGGFIGGQVARATRFDPHKGEVGWIAGKRVEYQDKARRRLGLSSMGVARRERANAALGNNDEYNRTGIMPTKVDGKNLTIRGAATDWAKNKFSSKKTST